MARISQNTIAEAAAAAASADTLDASTTVGDGTAEDTKIVFDGNALDFRIGIDDGDDTLEIGKGNAHGTTAHMILDTNGIIRAPLQPCFLAFKSANTASATGDGTMVTIVYNTEVFDTNADYDNSTGVFTAPVTGKYSFQGTVKLGGVSSSCTRIFGGFIGSNRDGQIFCEMPADGGEGLSGNQIHTISFAFILDMDASDTCYMVIGANGTSKSFAIQGNTQPDHMFSGHLIG